MDRTGCTLCPIQGRPNEESTWDGWRTAGEPTAPMAGIVFFVFFFNHVCLFLLYHEKKKKKERMKGEKEKERDTIDWHSFLSISFARQQWFGAKTELMADFVFNYRDCLKIWGSSRWLFCHMPSHSVLGDATEEPSSENNSFGLPICQLANCK